MAYLISRRTNNGFRCNCCHRSYTTTEWLDTLEEALAVVPRSPVKLESDIDSTDLESVRVTEGGTGKVIAEGTLEWAGGRGKHYQVERWFGFINDESFEEISGGKPGESWNDLTARLACEKAERDVAKAEAEVEAAKKKLDSLRGNLR